MQYSLSLSLIMEWSWEWLQFFNPFQRVDPKNQYKAHRISTITSALLVEVTFYIALCVYLFTKLMDNVVCMSNGRAYADTTGGRGTCITECTTLPVGGTCFDATTNQTNSIVAIASVCSFLFVVCVIKMWWIQKHDTDYEFPQYFIWSDLIFTVCVTTVIGVCLAVTISALQGASGDSDLERVTKLLIAALAIGLWIPIKLLTTLFNMTNVGIRDAFYCCCQPRSQTVIGR